MRADLSLDGSIAIVTGALGTLGPLWVSTLADAGATVVGIDIATDGAEELAARVGSTAGEFQLEQADVTDRDALDQVREKVASRLGTPSVLVSSAGIDQPPDSQASTYRVEQIPTSEFRQTLEVNLVGTFNSLQAFGAPMAAASRGSIVNIASLYASVAPDPGLYDHLEVDPPFLKPPAYGASKAGVVQLTRYFARLWGPSGVRVNALSPGGVLGDQDAEFVRKYCARVPLGRMAEAADLAGPLLFLASDASGYVTGHELRVDGGFTA